MKEEELKRKQEQKQMKWNETERIKAQKSAEAPKWPWNFCLFF